MHEISNSKMFNSFRRCPRPNVGQSQGATKISNHTRLGSDDIQRADAERVRSCCERQLCVSKSSATYSVAGRSPTQIAPSLRHSHRNASAIRCSRPERRARLRRGEPGNPCSLHRLQPVPSTGVKQAEERTKRGAPRSFAMSPCAPGQAVYAAAPSSFQKVSGVS